MLVAIASGVGASTADAYFPNPTESPASAQAVAEADPAQTVFTWNNNGGTYQVTGMTQQGANEAASGAAESEMTAGEATGTNVAADAGELAGEEAAAGMLPEFAAAGPVVAGAGVVAIGVCYAAGCFDGLVNAGPSELTTSSYHFNKVSPITASSTDPQSLWGWTEGSCCPATSSPQVMTPLATKHYHALFVSDGVFVRAMGRAPDEPSCTFSPGLPLPYAVQNDDSFGCQSPAGSGTFPHYSHVHAYYDITAHSRFSYHAGQTAAQATSAGYSVMSNTSPPNSSFANDLAKHIAANPDSAQAGRIAQAYVAAGPGSSTPNPYVTQKVIPDCTGLPQAICFQLYQQAGFGFVNTTVATFDEAIPTPEAQADQVIQQTPAAGTYADPTTAVYIKQNPDPADEPIMVPGIFPHVGADGHPETGPEWEHRIDGVPYAPSPDHHPNVTHHVLSDANSHPDLGPSGAVSTSPAPGTKIHPDDTVTVNENSPDTQPAGAGPGGGPPCDSTALPAINLNPLRVGIGNVFPFGIFGWLGDALTSWSVAGSAPTIDVPFVHGHLTFDFNQFEPAMEILRPVLLILSFFSLMWLVASAAMGFGGGGSEEAATE